MKQAAARRGRPPDFIGKQRRPTTVWLNEGRELKTRKRPDFIGDMAERKPPVVVPREPVAVPVLKFRDAMDHPKLFGPSYMGASWDRWRAVLGATFGEKLTQAERKSFRQVADRDPPKKRVGEAVYIVGRGGGKDSVASLIAAYVAITFEREGRLRLGEQAVVMCIACDRKQARIVHGYIRAFFEQIPVLKKLLVNADNESIELNNGVVIEVHTNSFRAVRGRSIICAIFDEVAFWRSENSATPDIETHAAVMPGLARMPGSMLVLISSAYKRSGLLYQRFKEYYGKNDDDVLVVRGKTLDFNPGFDARIIAKHLEQDPQQYSAEYNSEWRDDLATFISRDLLDAAVDPGVIVRPRQRNTTYRAFADPSGGRSDSFTAAIAHREDNMTVLDAVFECRPPFNPSTVTRDVAELLKGYGVNSVTGDRYAGEWVVEAFRKNGIRYEQSERDRSAIYLDALPLFTAGRARLLDNERMVNQFASLERRTFPTGKDRVDHGTGGHDDICNSAAGALVLAAGKGQPMVINEQMLKRSAVARPRSNLWAGRRSRFSAGKPAVFF